MSSDGSATVVAGPPSSNDVQCRGADSKSAKPARDGGNQACRRQSVNCDPDGETHDGEDRRTSRNECELQHFKVPDRWMPRSDANQFLAADDQNRPLSPSPFGAETFAEAVILASDT